MKSFDVATHTAFDTLNNTGTSRALWGFFREGSPSKRNFFLLFVSISNLLFACKRIFPFICGHLKPC